MNKFFGRILQILNDSEAKRERQIFMLVLALVLSVLLWVLATLNQDYQMQLSYDIAIKDIPEDLFLTKQNSFSLEVNARGPGVDLIVESIRANR
ncbi:MAG: hypothetical protein MRZ79_17830, partial [Bacteroidia bacterium]|nr:hypothetical protein [Bacteroidia bacterium]